MNITAKPVRFLIERKDGITFDLTGYVTQCQINNNYLHHRLEAEFTVIGDGVQVLLDKPEVKTTRKPEPLSNFEHVPEVRRCGYCRQLNDKTQLYCGHCGGEL